MAKWLSFWLLASAACAGCTRSEGTAPADAGAAYFPVAVGTWVEYEVDSIALDQAVGIEDTVRYRLRELLAEAFVDAEGRTCQRVERSVLNDSGLWLLRDVWTAHRGNATAERLEENRRLLKLVLPIRPGMRWNQHALLPEPEFEMEIVERDQPLLLGTLIFSKAALVRSTALANLIDTVLLEERYASGVGLVHKRWQRTNTQFDIPSQRFYTRGTKLTMQAVAYGN
jgi:hypothetical protein